MYREVRTRVIYVNELAKKLKEKRKMNLLPFPPNLLIFYKGIVWAENPAVIGDKRRRRRQGGKVEHAGVGELRTSQSSLAR